MAQLYAQIPYFSDYKVHLKSLYFFKNWQCALCIDEAVQLNGLSEHYSYLSQVPRWAIHIVFQQIMLWYVKAPRWHLLRDMLVREHCLMSKSHNCQSQTVKMKNLMDLWKINVPYNLMRLMYEHKPFNDCSLILCLIIWCAL